MKKKLRNDVGNIFIGLSIFVIGLAFIFLPKGDIYCGSNCVMPFILSASLGLIVSLLFCGGIELKYNFFGIAEKRRKTQ